MHTKEVFNSAALARYVIVDNRRVVRAEHSRDTECDHAEPIYVSVLARKIWLACALASLAGGGGLAGWQIWHGGNPIYTDIQTFGLGSAAGISASVAVPAVGR